MTSLKGKIPVIPSFQPFFSLQKGFKGIFSLYLPFFLLNFKNNGTFSRYITPNPGKDPL
jgi:hypothetical protein